MGLRIERVPTLKDNYSYVVECTVTARAAIIDAPEADPVIRRAALASARVAKVLSTHHHPDHTAANPELAEHYGVPVLGHASDAGRLAGMTDGLEEGDTVAVGEETARVLFIPAHTRGHIAYFFEESRALFCGDTLFAGGCGRLFEGTPEMMWEALQKLGRLPDDTRVYCGHEYTAANLRFAAHVEPDNQAVKAKLARVRELRAKAAPDWHDATPVEMTIPSTIGEEHETNPFMRARDPEELGRLRREKDTF